MNRDPPPLLANCDDGPPRPWSGCIDLVTDNVKAGIGDAISESVADALLSIFGENGSG